MLNALPKFIARRLLERALDQKQHRADDTDMYLHKIVGLQMIWPYDSRGRLIGEDVYEPLRHQAELIKLDAKDVVTTAQARQLLSPTIEALPSFDEMVLGKMASPAA